MFSFGILDYRYNDTYTYTDIFAAASICHFPDSLAFGDITAFDDGVIVSTFCE